MTVLLWLVGSLVFAEVVRPLRPRVVPRVRRWPANVAAGLRAAPVAGLLVQPLSYALVVRQRPNPLRALGRIAALDLLYWAWHRANHQVPALWALHRYHHVDPELDVSTAIRFHQREMIATVAFRALQVGLARPTRGELRLYDMLFAIATVLQHANVDLGRWDPVLARIIVTPRYHGLHHTVHGANRNWSTLFPWWDRLAGTQLEVAGGPPPPIGTPETVRVQIRRKHRS